MKTKSEDVQLFRVEGRWNKPTDLGRGVDGQFITLDMASRFILEFAFDEADIHGATGEGSLVTRDGERGWYFPGRDQFIPLGTS